MGIRRIAHSTLNRFAKTAEGVKRFSRLERVIAAFCIFIPLFLLYFDNWQIRGSISAYYNMEEAQVFYFSLTVASMLFIVNGVVKQQRAYNTLLGIMLAGVILFNHDDASVIHAIFAIAFFGGNAAVILYFSSKKELWFKILLVVGIVISMTCYFCGCFTLFWAEWISFFIIALHYILESWNIID